MRSATSSSFEAPEKAAACSVSSRRLFRITAMRWSSSAVAGEACGLLAAFLPTAFFAAASGLRVLGAFFFAAARGLRFVDAFLFAAMFPPQPVRKSIGLDAARLARLD